MMWSCGCGRPNHPEAVVCAGCGASRPPLPLDPSASPRGSYRSSEAVTAFRVVGDAFLLYGRGVMGFLAASSLMVLPYFLFEAWKWKTDHTVLAPGILRPLAALILLAAWNAFWLSLMIRLAADELEAGSEGLGGAVGKVTASMVFWVMLAEVLVSLSVGLATLLFIVPGIIAAVRFSLTLPVVVCEGLGPVKAMRRSSRLVKGHGWSVFGAFALTGLISLACLFAVGATLTVARWSWAGWRSVFELWSVGVTMPTQLILAPLSAIVPTLFYFPLRSRFEALERGGPKWVAPEVEPAEAPGSGEA